MIKTIQHVTKLIHLRCIRVYTFKLSESTESVLNKNTKDYTDISSS